MPPKSINTRDLSWKISFLCSILLRSACVNKNLIFISKKRVFFAIRQKLIFLNTSLSRFF